MMKLHGYFRSGRYSFGDTPALADAHLIPQLLIAAILALSAWLPVVML